MHFVRFRSANGLFEPIWNRDRIDHVHNVAAEAVGMEQRVRVHEDTVALRDMVPNHLCTCRYIDDGAGRLRCRSNPEQVVALKERAG
jgi:glucose-6-phosphate 1-dehydrogenase